MKCSEFNEYSVLCMGCDYPRDIKCAKRISHGYDTFKILNNKEIIKTLNVNKIKTIDDIKRVLDVLDIKFEVREGISNLAYEKIKDLCN